MNKKDILDFIFEMGQLKKVRHEGWRLINTSDMDSVGEHSLRAAQIGFILAKLEGCENPYKVCSVLVFHDIGECRIGDVCKVANRYIQANEEKAVKDQTKKLDKTGKEIFEFWKQIENKNGDIGIIAKDADLLEQAITAKEYVEKGFDKASDWIKNVSNYLETESAKNLLKIMKKKNSNDWWQSLKKIE